MTAVFPTSIKSFTQFQDQPGPDNVTIDYAYITNELHDEIVAIETILGANPLGNYLSLAQAFADLSQRKASIIHTHCHNLMVEGKEDHTQYTLCDGSRPFGNPIAGQPAVYVNQAVTLGQIAAYDTYNAFVSAATAAIAGYCYGAFPYGYGDPGVTFNQTAGGGYIQAPPASMPFSGSVAFDLTAERVRDHWVGSVPAWVLTGGYVGGVTNGLGQFTFSLPYTLAVQSIAFLAVPATDNGSGIPLWDPTQLQLVIRNIGLTSCTLEFSDLDYATIPRQIAFCWLAIGL